MAHLYIPQLTLREKVQDMAMVPLMYFVLGGWTKASWTERPQRTHKWNNIKFPKARLAAFEREKMVRCDGTPDICPMRVYGIPMFHLPLFGGWKHYVVITPKQPEDGWHIGWTCDAVTGASRIRLTTPVRVLTGPGPVDFFGISAKRGTQLYVSAIGQGMAGDGGKHSRLLFL